MDKNDQIRRQVRDLLELSAMEILYKGATAIRGMGINLSSLDSVKNMELGNEEREQDARLRQSGSYDRP